MYVFYTAQRTRLPIRACVKIIVLFSVTMAPFEGGRRISSVRLFPSSDGGMYPIAMNEEKGIILAGHSTTKIPI